MEKIEDRIKQEYEAAKAEEFALFKAYNRHLSSSVKIKHLRQLIDCIVKQETLKKYVDKNAT